MHTIPFTKLYRVRMKTSAAILGFLIAMCISPRASAAVECESLASLKLPHTQITRAQTVPAGKFSGTPSGLLAPGAPANRPYSLLPAFCRVAATLTPSSDSESHAQPTSAPTDWIMQAPSDPTGAVAPSNSTSAQSCASHVRQGILRHVRLLAEGSPPGCREGAR